MSKIENWSIVSIDDNPYKAPELKDKVVCGEAYGHKSFPDGAKIRTSSIMEINLKEGYVLTKNTKYTLGEINPVYKKWCEDNDIDLSVY
jgi:hypothetical protein